MSRRTRVSADPRLLAVVVVVVIAVAAIWAQVARPAPVKAAAPQPQSLPITAQTLVCPQAGGTPSKGAARIGYADAALGSAGDSTLTIAPLDPDAVVTGGPIEPGHAWHIDGPKTLGPVRIAMTGPIAAASSAVQFTRQSVGSSLQVSAAPCEAPTTEAWFAGFSSGVGTHATLLLSNVDAVAATVDIGIYADAAPPNPQAQHGLVVPPNSQKAVRLDTLAPGFTNAVAHVTATSGRVVAAVRYDAENGSIPLGVEWIPRTDGPALTQTVPGIVGGDGARHLILSTPGDIDATVSLSIVTPDGSFTPTGFDAVNVPAGQVVSVDLADQLQKEAAAVVVTSTEPVVAGAISSLPPDKAGGSDVGFTAAVPAVSAPTVVAGGETGSDRHTSLLLTAPDTDANLTLTVLPDNKTSSPLVSPLTVPAGTTMAIDLGSLSKDPAPAVEITPETGGPLYAGWSLQEHIGATSDLTSFPVRSPVTTLERPPVRTDLRAGLPEPAQTPSPPASPSAPASPAESDEPSEPASSDLFSPDDSDSLDSGPLDSEPAESPDQSSPASSSQPSP